MGGTYRILGWGRLDFSIIRSHTQPAQEDENCPGPSQHMQHCEVVVLHGLAGLLDRTAVLAGLVGRLGRQGEVAGLVPAGRVAGLVCGR